MPEAGSEAQCNIFRASLRHAGITVLTRPECFLGARKDKIFTLVYYLWAS